MRHGCGEEGSAAKWTQRERRSPRCCSLWLKETARPTLWKARVGHPAKIDLFLSFNQRAERAFFGAGKFAWAHAENFVGCRSAILFARAIWSRESEPK
jgi:hypothetical protein